MAIGTIQDIPAGDLSPWPRNYRRHPPEQLKRLARSLKRNGQRKAIVVQAGTNRIIAGHGIWEIAANLGWKTVRCDVWECSDEQAEAFLVDDNELQRFAEDDEEVLASLLDDLRGTEFESLSYDTDEIDALLGNLARADMEDLGPEEPPEEPTTKQGDLWQCGEHRVLCGDSQEGAGIKRLLAGASPRLLATDPPYGVDYANVLGGRENQKQDGWDDIAGDNLDDAGLYSLIHDALVLVPAPVLFVWHSWKRIELVLRAIRDCGWKPTSEIVWVKNALVFGRSDYQWRHECCIYAKREGAGRVDDRTQTTVWEIAKTTGAMHPTQKPVEVFEIPMANHTERGDCCYDPFLGSGTIMIAAEKLGRICYGMEIEPRYVDVAVKRWEEMTGQKAELIESAVPSASRT